MNYSREKIFVFGASGHAKVVIDIIERQREFEIAFLIDDDSTLKGKVVYGYTVRGGKSDLLELREVEGVLAGIVAIGSNRARKSVARWLTENGFRLVSAVHPSAQVARGVTIGAGTVVMAGAVVNSDTTIGDNVIVNTRTSVDHDCTIGNGVHLAPGVTLCGTVRVGEGAFVCAGATVIPNLTVGCGVTIGAGAVVIRDAPDDVTLVGAPARVLQR